MEGRTSGAGTDTEQIFSTRYKVGDSVAALHTLIYKLITLLYFQLHLIHDGAGTLSARERMQLELNTVITSDDRGWWEQPILSEICMYSCSHLFTAWARIGCVLCM